MAITPRDARVGAPVPKQSQAEIERLRERIAQLEAIARLNLETIRNMQRATAQDVRDAERLSRSIS
jgi:hypothetical protein